MLSERMDIALAAGLDGVHLPEHSCPALRLRNASPAMLYGKSVHSLEGALSAEKKVWTTSFQSCFYLAFKTEIWPTAGAEKAQGGMQSRVYSRVCAWRNNT